MRNYKSYYECLYHKLLFDGVRVQMDMTSSDNPIQLKEDSSLHLHERTFTSWYLLQTTSSISLSSESFVSQSINLALLSPPPQHHHQTSHSLLLLYALTLLLRVPLPSSSIHLCNVTHPICHDVQRFLASLPQAYDLTSLLDFLTTYLFSY
jgi:hypothetical protein